LRRTGKLPEAIALLRATMPDAASIWAENHRDLLTIYNNLLVYMSEANQLEAMPAVFAEADAVIRRTGQESSMQGLAITQLKGVRLMKLDQMVQAEAIFTRVAAQRRAVFGRSAGLSVDLLQLARTKLALGKFDQAQALLTEARPMAAEKLSPGAVPTLFMGLGLAEAMAESGDVTSSERVLGELTPMIAAIPKQGLPHGVLAKTLAIVRLKQGRIADARTALDQSEAIFMVVGPSGTSYLKAFPKLRERIASGR
jgi:non-specific serine/threonine protein kinase/serine/threonine-protein kinase